MKRRKRKPSFAPAFAKAMAGKKATAVETKKIDTHVKSEIAIGIVLLVAIAMGFLVWNSNKNWQDEQNKQNEVAPMVFKKAEIEAPKNFVFLGDSITALEDWNKLFGVTFITNAGISGNTTDDIIVRLDATIESKPQKLFLMMGINDLLRGKSVDHVMENYKTVLDRVKSQTPKTTIYIQSVLPTNNDNSTRFGTVDAQKIIALNEQLKTLADGKKIFFIDLYPAFCGEGNKMPKKYASDGLHPSLAGYELWKGLISQYVLEN